MLNELLDKPQYPVLPGLKFQAPAPSCPETPLALYPQTDNTKNYVGNDKVWNESQSVKKLIQVVQKKDNQKHQRGYEGPKCKNSPSGWMKCIMGSVRFKSSQLFF
jgi:hypothetical protein